MADNAKNKTATVIPTMRYNDAAAAIEWLCEAFGFEKHFVHADEEGRVVYSQLAITGGNGMVMVSPVREGHEFDRYQGPSAEKATQSAYIVVDDAKAHHARAVEAGAKVVVPLNDEHGGLAYSCLDFVGHLWNFGTFDPWKVKHE